MFCNLFSKKKVKAPVEFGILEDSTVSNFERIELTEGPVVLIWPKDLSSESLGQMFSWLAFMESHQELKRYHKLNKDKPGEARLATYKRTVS
ncbi:hypothetical protein [Gimesia aquarii]|uniref:Uncharacterized protein n=1 Tax=Gimesia aquarii TaxID=2527964 RepID=A0A517VP59_9PLAN|nr:hypothetical protein [Gimesia aquarii]QDT94806.1 hypothetical protein V144x_02380 [Gimesia aquarii]